MAKTDNQHTEANSESSAPSARKSTSRIVNLTPEAHLEILQEALRKCQEAGIEIMILPWHDPDNDLESVLITIAGVSLKDRNFVMVREAAYA